MTDAQELEVHEIYENDKAGIDKLSQLADDIWREYFPIILSDAQIDYMLDKFQSSRAITEQLKVGYRYFMIYLDGKPQAYFSVQARPETDVLFLSKLYVRGENRGLGLGGKMLEFIKNIARKSKLNAIELTCNKHNENTLAFYRKKGFVAVDEFVADIGGGFAMDDYVMQMSL